MSTATRRRQLEYQIEWLAQEPSEWTMTIQAKESPAIRARRAARLLVLELGGALEVRQQKPEHLGCLIAEGSGLPRA